MTGIASATLTGFGIFGLLLLVTTCLEINRKKKKLDCPTSFMARHNAMLEEIQSLKTEEQRYQDSIQGAFSEAREHDLLYVFEVPYDDIESDKIRYHANESDSKTRLTRIYPIMTQELAEKIREYEVKAWYGFAPELRAQIYLDARQIKWRVEEVPAEVEPPNLKNADRIYYPDFSVFRMTPELQEAARKLLDYGDEYVEEQADLLEERGESFEVTEE